MQWIRKIVKAFFYKFGYDISPIEPGRGGKKFEISDFSSLLDEYSGILKKYSIRKAHYGSGNRPFGKGWVNIDRHQGIRDPMKLYMRADLVSRHPFPSNYFNFAFAEDFLEHLMQDESLIFLSEVFRCLQRGGVLRLSFPGLKGVLRRHYRASNYEGAIVGREEAFTRWDHKHFYCEQSLSMVARHIGFRGVEIVAYGKSEHEELNNLDSREDQQDLNIYIELIK